MKVELLNQTHPERDGAALDRYAALCDGGEEWRQHLPYWLPQNAGEPADIYKDRKDRAVYHNYVGGIIGILVGYLFAEAPRVEGADGDYYASFLADCDLAGRSFGRFWRDVFEAALIGRDAYCWVNAPSRPVDVDVTSRADEEALGFDRLYLVGLKAQHVLDWGEDRRGNLTSLLFREIDEPRAAVEMTRTRVYRWTHIDGTAIRRWEWTARKDRSVPAPDDDAAEMPPILHGFGRVPIVRLRLPKGLHALRLLHDPAVAHIRSANDYDWSLHRSAHALMAIKRKFGGEAPKVGPGYYLELEPEEEISFVEPGGQSYTAQAERVASLKDELFRVIGQMAIAADSDATRSRMSGESKARDWQATDVLMAAFSSLVLTAMESTLDVVSSGRGDSSKPHVGGLDGWQTESLETFMAQAALAVEAKEMSPTFRRVVARRQAERLLQDEASEEDLGKIREELDAADGALWTDPRAAGAPADAGAKVQDTALNGTQIAESRGIVESVAAGTISRESGSALLRIALQISPKEAEDILGPKGFVPTAEPAKPNPFAPAE